LRHPRGPDHAARARDILHVHRLSQQLREARREHAGEDVVVPAGRKSDHHGERPRRPVLRQRRGRSGKRHQDGQQTIHRGSPFFLFFAAPRPAARN
jgi:hypothetical protein